MKVRSLESVPFSRYFRLCNMWQSHVENDRHFLSTFSDFARLSTNTVEGSNYVFNKFYLSAKGVPNLELKHLSI